MTRSPRTGVTPPRAALERTGERDRVPQLIRPSIGPGVAALPARSASRQELAAALTSLAQVP